MGPPDPAARPSPAAEPGVVSPVLRRIGADDARRCRAPARRLIDVARECGVPLEHLWGAQRTDGLIDLGLLVIVQPGRTAMFFPSAVARVADVPVMSRLVELACAGIPAEQANMAQALLTPSEDLQIAAFAQAGFTRLADLSYMDLRVPSRSPKPELPGDVELLPWSPERRPQFIAALEASYEKTLDCPALQGLRRTPDVLEGHMATGKFEPELWTLLKVRGQPAGVMLLNPVSVGGCVEVVYLGIAPSQRGRGLGAMLLHYANWQCATRKRRCLTLAVDESNTPAVKLYTQLGYTRTARRIAMMRRISG